MQKIIIKSINPNNLKNILNGIQTILISKTMPKCDYPIDVYLYCTKSKNYLVKEDNYETIEPLFNYKICYPSEYDELVATILNGKIVAKFTLNKVVEILPFKKQKRDKVYITYLSHCGDVNWGNKTCLDQVDFENYLGLKTGYGWHIDNLQIFDKPMELSDFYRNCKDYHNGWSGCDDVCGYAENNECYGGKIKINNPPQSWSYAYKE